MQSESCLTWLSQCNIHVAHMESKFDVEGMCSIRCVLCVLLDVLQVIVIGNPYYFR